MRHGKGLTKKVKNASKMAKKKRSTPYLQKIKSLQPQNTSSPDSIKKILGDAGELRKEAVQTIKYEQNNEYYAYKKLTLNKSASLINSKKTKMSRRKGRKQSVENIQPQTKFIKANLTRLNNVRNPYNIQERYHTYNAISHSGHNITDENPNNESLAAVQYTPNAKFLQRDLSPEQLQQSMIGNINTTLISKNVTQASIEIIQEDSREMAPENVPCDFEEGQKNSIIKNRKFCAKFIKRTEPKLDSTLIDMKSNISTEKLFKKVYHERNKMLDEISYDEIVVEDAKTVEVSSETKSNKIQKDYETLSQIQEKVSRRLSDYSFSQGSSIDLDESKGRTKGCVRLNDIVPNALPFQPQRPRIKCIRAGPPYTIKRTLRLIKRKAVSPRNAYQPGWK
ncbi:unnamed protein product [Moneuplotes crassus]|uniref:Uncharacterized protein n=1 Tax=Euplotes crassus TaxID=5936 RepID=A0AAD1UFU4_EUPCR|nr:unnamed protein product [Moneuplotes crassus]